MSGNYTFDTISDIQTINTPVTPSTGYTFQSINDVRTVDTALTNYTIQTASDNPTTTTTANFSNVSQTRRNFASVFKTSLRLSSTSRESHLDQLAISSVAQTSSLVVTGNPRQYGLFSLYEPPDGPSASDTNSSVDIIALHGLDGTPFKTWTYTEMDSSGKSGKSRDTFWLQDFLPDVFPGSRIYTYGYNAQILFSKATGEIVDFASTLLELILDRRTRREQQRRPIVFICHSMGGLVVKQALAIAEKNPGRYGNIRAATSAILFMATPHRGSKSAAILARFASLSNGSLAGLGISRLKGGIRSDLVEGLAWDSRVVKKIAKEFLPFTDGSIRFYSFIEDLITAPLKSRVVDDVSGRLNVATEVVVHMAGEDHRSIARYNSRTSPSYEKVLAKLKEAVLAATIPVNNIVREEDIPCLRTLAFSTMTTRKIEADTAHPRTCDWILKHPSFTAWLNASRGLLWLKGHPGSGKSTIMAYVHRHILSQRTSKTIRLDFFFTGRGEPLQKTTLGMYRSLLHQIYTQSITARELIYEAYKAKNDNQITNEQHTWNWQVAELKALLTRVIKEVAAKNEITLFIDALDEAIFPNGEKAALGLVEYFYELNDMTFRDDDGTMRGVRICISCRHYPVVGSLGPGLEVRVEDENRLDLRRYIHDRLCTGIRGWESEPSEMTEQIVDAICKKAAGVFQWAVLRVPELVKSLNDGELEFDEVVDVVAGESNELFALYETILKNDISVTARKKALLFLQWICLAERPLTLTELRFAMACDDDNWSQDCCEINAKGFIKSDSQMEKLVVSLSAGLAVVLPIRSTNRIQFVHETVNDFLRSSGLQLLSSLIGDQVHTTEYILGISHTRISRSCLNYLRIDSIVDASNAWEAWDDPIPKLLDYASCHVFNHASKAESYGQSQESLGQILQLSPSVLEVWHKTMAKLKFGVWKGNKQVRLHDCDLYVSSTELLFIATAFNIQTIVRAHLQNPEHIKTYEFPEYTPLELAAERGYLQLSELFLSSGTHSDATKNSAFERAKSNNHAEIVKLFIQHAAEVPGGMSFSYGALQAAAVKGNIGVIDTLLDAGVDVNDPGNWCGPALQQACKERSNLATVRHLLDRGANINFKGGYYGSALQAAVHCMDMDVVDYLIAKGADNHIRGGNYETILQAAISCLPDPLPLVRYFLSKGVDVNVEGGEYGSALQAAAVNSTFGILKVLIDHGAEVNVQSGHWGSPLLIALQSKDEQSVKLFLDHGAKTTDAGGNLENALQAAVVGTSLKLVKDILALGVDINIRGGTYGSALQASVVCAPQLTPFLLAKGADINTLGNEFGSPLYAAVAHKRYDIIKMLLEHGANPNMMVQKGANAIGVSFSYCLQKAADMGNIAIVKLLLDHGADANLISQVRGSESALPRAAECGHIDVVKLLLARGAMVAPYQLKDSILGPFWCYDGAIFRAARMGHREIVALLLSSGENAGASNEIVEDVIRKCRGGQRVADEHY